MGMQKVIGNCSLGDALLAQMMPDPGVTSDAAEPCSPLRKCVEHWYSAMRECMHVRLRPPNNLLGEQYGIAGIQWTLHFAGVVSGLWTVLHAKPASSRFIRVPSHNRCCCM